MQCGLVSYRYIKSSTPRLTGSNYRNPNSVKPIAGFQPPRYSQMHNININNLTLSDIAAIKDPYIRKLLGQQILLQQSYNYNRRKRNIYPNSYHTTNISLYDSGSPNIIYQLPENQQPQIIERVIVEKDTPNINYNNRGSSLKIDSGDNDLDFFDVTLEDLQEAIEEAQDSAQEADLAVDEIDDIRDQITSR